MRITGEGPERHLVWSASDLKAAAECEFAWMRAIDARLGRIAVVDEPVDATLARAARLGDAHEARQLDTYRARYPGRVVEIEAARSSDAEAMGAAVVRTAEALASDAAVIYQAAFRTREFVGFADFLVRDDDARGEPTGPWRVQDTKLARRARVTALMQLAAYVDQLDAVGIPRSDEVDLILGDGSVSTHCVDDLLPVFALRRARLRALAADRRIDLGECAGPLAWGDDRGDLGVAACGRCATCEIEVVRHRDLLLVAGMRPLQRRRLRAAGIQTIDALAAAPAVPAGMPVEAFAALRTQAALQVGADGATPPVRTTGPRALAALPAPDSGDIFFDFEGDPLYSEDEGRRWGIDYLFGWVDDADRYTAVWALTLAEERRALERFLAFVADRREHHPRMHIYHYAPYETAHLLAMAARHGVGEHEVDEMLRHGVFVDLYPIVRRALTVGSRSYSIKQLEPLYMGEEKRAADVKSGDVSIERFVWAQSLRAEGRDDEAKVILDDLADYNRYDCVSTRRLRDYLLARAGESGVVIADAPAEGIDERAAGAFEPSALAAELLRQADVVAASADAGGPTRRAADADATARAMRLASAAIDYYPREHKTFWAEHFRRLTEPSSMWAEARGCFVARPSQSELVEDWHLPERGRLDRRIVRLRGDLAPGTAHAPGARVFALYETPPPFDLPRPDPRRMYETRRATVVAADGDAVLIQETAPRGEGWPAFPVALTPDGPPAAGQQQGAIEEWAQTVADAAPRLPDDAVSALLARRAPVIEGGRPRIVMPERSGDDIADLVAALRQNPPGYLAVQGPPGTGKTYAGSHVVARLVVEQGWRVGVTAQSHKVVEHMLGAVVSAGVPADQVAKTPREATPEGVAFTALPQQNALASFASAHPSGYVIGGTAWDFAHPGRVPRRSLDLLVIDEAGQFSLASTIAVAVSARRILLLGDPQQLPQVSQGIHPEPVDTSALGWLLDGEAVVPPELGHFLPHSRRMRPELAEAVSHLAYRGRLDAHTTAAGRTLEGVAPGVVPVAVRHADNQTESPEEATAVVDLVRDLVGREWSDPGAGVRRALTSSDIIVVTPYNAQQLLVSGALAAAGFGEVPVGTVDKFQGQEAAVAIVSLAASAVRGAPRGADFLLLQNRLNVAVSRAQHTAFVVYGPGLLDDLPSTAEGVIRLSAFARLVGAG